MKTKSLKLNMILNAINGALNVLFPLITFPFISNIFGVDLLGKYQFSSSFISYFLLIASLGISTYAIREGARIRDNKDQFSKFANQMFTINMGATLLSYCLLAICMVAIPKLYSYTGILLILSINILLQTIGVEWLYSIYEDYFYITIRGIVFHILSLVALFVFVRTPNDIYIYSIISVVASGGRYLLNFFRARKYCKLRFTKDLNIKEHWKPIMLLFGMQIATTIFVSSDTTILGFMVNDYVVGIYSTSTKIYSAVKTVLSAILVASIPRLSATLANDNSRFNDTLTDIYKTLLTFLIPAIVGIIFMRNEIVLLISNVDYIEATESLFILSIALFFCLGAWFWGQCVLVPMRKESFVFKVTLISAVINIVLNLILIPFWKEKAAALTTVISEAVAFFMQWYEGRKYAKTFGIIKITIKIIAGCLGICLTCLLIQKYINHFYLKTILCCLISIVVYMLIEFILKNSVLYDIVKKIRRRRNGKATDV